jgi:hypothetical protein
MTTPAAPRQFRVYIGPREGTGLYVQARIFDNRRTMLAALDDPAVGVRLSRTVQAVMENTTRWSFASRGRRLVPCIGRVNFHRAALGPDLVAHEFAHGVIAWVDRKRLLRAQRELGTEEQLTYAFERMLRRFQARAIRLGFCPSYP